MSASNRSKSTQRDLAGKYAYSDWDQLVHEKSRLAILMALVCHSDDLAFRELKELCLLTDGNLHRHLKALTGQKLIEVRKKVIDGKPAAYHRLTPNGRERFLQHLGLMRQMAADADRAMRNRPS